MCQSRHHINSATPRKLWVTASHTRTSKSSVSMAATVIRLPILWVSVVVVVLPMSMKTKRLNRCQLFLIPLSHTLLYMCYTWISFLFPRIECTPSIPLCDYFLFLSIALSLSLSNMERNPLVELICFNECLLPCWDGIKMSLRERRGRWDSAPLKCLFLSNLPYSPVVNTRDTCTQLIEQRLRFKHWELREIWAGVA